MQSGWEATNSVGSTDARAEARDAPVMPRVVPRNSPPTFYRGSGRIDRFRGGSSADGDRPEDWVASTVTRFGAQRAGLTVLEDGISLRDEVRRNPARWLGAAGAIATPELALPLVKLLDAGQRLPVHVHPDDSSARALGVWPNGKAEAWFVIDAPESATVYVGWARDITSAELTGWVAEQDVTAMLGAMHEVEVRAGDSVYVPPGTAHAIGAGIFLVEVQQAADLSILLEWDDFFPDSSGAFLGVDRTAALSCVDLTALSTAAVEALFTRSALSRGAGRQLLPAESARYFSASVHSAGALLPAEYRTLVVLSGAGRLRATGAGRDVSVDVTRGDTLAVPAAGGPLELDGSSDLCLLAFGPGG